MLYKLSPKVANTLLYHVLATFGEVYIIYYSCLFSFSKVQLLFSQ